MKGSGMFLVLMLNLGSAAAFADMQLCYVLDGILVIYGIVLTILYCRLRLRAVSVQYPEKQSQGEGIYEGLKPHVQDTYETLQMKKKGIV